MIDLTRALRETPVPPLPEGLEERVLADRAAGVRAASVADAARPGRQVRPAFVVGAAAAAAVVLVLTRIWSPGASGPPRSQSGFAADPFFFPQQAYAQAPGWTPPGPKYALVAAGDGSRLSEGRWRYWAQTLGLGGEIERTVTVQRSRAARVETWLVVNRIKGPYSWANVDSIWLERASLSPIRLRRHSGRQRVTTVDFGKDSVASTYIDPLHGLNERGVKPLPPGQRALLLPSGFNLLYVLLGTLPLDLTWAGSIYVVPPRTIDGRVYFPSANLRVVGEGTVSVPAGTFECWQVKLESSGSPSDGSTFWVTKSGGWVVRMTSPTSQWPDQVLLSYEASR